MKKDIKRLITSALFGIAAVLTGFLAPKDAYAGDIVQLDTMYTYDEMIKDLGDLKRMFPDNVEIGSIGTSSMGKDIPYIAIGNRYAGHNVFVQSTVHGREYMGTQMVMGLAEDYLTNQQDLLTGICFYIVPMSNPDGVEIAQFGSTRITDTDTVNFVNVHGHNREWKATATGVDINRNFPVGWATLDMRVIGPTYMDYKGPFPSSEPETQALINFAQARDYDCYISYHQQGDVIYYDEPGNSLNNSAASALLARTVANITGYRLCQMGAGVASGEIQLGGFSDWVQITLDKPACTIELGTALPPSGQAAMRKIYMRNQNTWRAIAELYL